jgi:hypothetical protein
MVDRLLDRQVSLLEYLTSSNAIFGNRVDGAVDLTAIELAAFDLPDWESSRALLDLEARFSYEKRMSKITAVFPRTFELLGFHRPEIVREFVRACPPTDIDRLHNARQFSEFLLARAQREPSLPPHLLDVAACEFACAVTRAGAEDRRLAPDNGATRPQPGWVRRRSGHILLRCAYDVRSVFEGGSAEAAPAERETRLVIGMPDGAEQPQVSEVMPIIFDLLAMLDDWTDPAVFGDTPELTELVRQMELHGLIEVRR